MPEQSRGAGPRPAKVVLVGPPGAGKTTAVRAVSEIAPLRTDAGGTTVALDFGRVTLDAHTRVYLFGTPGRRPDLGAGADGVLVVLDPRRPDEAYPVLDYVERTRLPFVIGLNLFDRVLDRSLGDLRWALSVREEVPMCVFDARAASSVRSALRAVLRVGTGATQAPATLADGPRAASTL
ncbi:ATP/GTP-binding protein [Amycolatopsis ultiminotia]|uniref:ATP/GTP-binding protein n=1 Tax=Amycolatopsis ultiminotia TaxID=543629 RepID=A0ABP6X1W6_9PSEU